MKIDVLTIIKVIYLCKMIYFNVKSGKMIIEVVII